MAARAGRFPMASTSTLSRLSFRACSFAWAALTLSGGVVSRSAMLETIRRPREHLGTVGPSRVNWQRMAAKSAGLASVG